MTGRPSHLNTRYKFELTPRQREVMALVAAGRTNGEIAELLGITLEGAKYHVSEILAKLNVDTREEAAMAWCREHAPSRRLANLARGFVGFAGLKWAGVAVGGAGAAALGAVVLVAALGRGGSPSPNSAAVDPTPLQARPCQQVTDELQSMQSASGSWIFRVQVLAADAPCYLRGSVSLVADDVTNAVVAAQSPNPFPPANRLPLAADAPIDQLIQTPSQFVAQFEWTNWCGPARVVYFNAGVSAFNQKESFDAQTVMDQVPPCGDAAQPSTVALIPPATVADQGLTTAVFPTCDVSVDHPSDGVQMQLWTAAPWGPGRAAGLTVDFDANRTPPCRLDDSLTVTLLDAAGQALPVVGNPAVVPVHIGSYSEILTIPLKWENWCGTGPVTVRASLGTAVVEHSVATPPACGAPARLSWLTAGAP